MVVEQADIGGDQDPHLAVLRIDGAVGRVFGGSQLPEVPLQDRACAAEGIPFAELHAGSIAAASGSVPDRFT